MVKEGGEGSGEEAGGGQLEGGGWREAHVRCLVRMR